MTHIFEMSIRYEVWWKAQVWYLGIKSTYQVSETESVLFVYHSSKYDKFQKCNLFMKSILCYFSISCIPHWQLYKKLYKYVLLNNATGWKNILHEMKNKERTILLGRKLEYLKADCSRSVAFIVNNWRWQITCLIIKMICVFLLQNIECYVGSWVQSQDLCRIQQVLWHDWKWEEHNPWWV